VHTVILGAGISGLSSAYALGQRRGETYNLYEKEMEIGGLCRTRQQDGFTFDVVSHVLHFRTAAAEQFVHAILDGHLQRIVRNAWIFFRGHYVPYPFQTHLGFLPAGEQASCLWGYARAWVDRQFNGARPPANFGAWIRQHFGAGIAQSFMIPYNTKLWGLPPEEMSADWVSPFVPRISFSQAVAGLLSKRNNEMGYNSSFYYPESGGIQALVDGLASRTHGLSLGRKVVQVDLDRKTVLFQTGETAPYDRLVSTIPLNALVLSARGIPEDLRRAAAELRSTSLLNVTCCVGHPLPHRYHWVYFPEPEFPFFRLLFPANLSPAMVPENCSLVCAEISNPDLTRRDELELQTRELLISLGMIRRPSDIVSTSCTYLDHAYPVHDLKREALVKRLLEFLRSRDVWSIGRFGSWRYSSIDDAIVQALEVAQQISAPGPVKVPELLA
jgi:protoporphyrinogen oxidase